MLYIVGAGLKPEHISVEALGILKKCEKIYLDRYTVPISDDFVRKLEEIIGKKVVEADRSLLEEGATEIVEPAKNEDIAVLAFGDPLSATTHVTITILADELDVKWRYIPGVSILTYIPSRLGLEHYKFGWTVTIPHHWKYAPSFYERIRENGKRRMHTLVLLDVGNEPMTVPKGIEALLYWAEREGRNWKKIVGIARASYDDEFIAYGEPEELVDLDWGAPPHSIVIPGKLHPVEEESLGRFAVGKR